MVVIIGDRNETFTYVPMHLHYILTELLKNSVRATVEVHGDRCDETGEELPRVRVVVASGNKDVSIKVSDEGGGIPYDSMDKCWSYVHSSVKWEPTPSSGQSKAEAKEKKQSSIWSPTSQQQNSSIWSPHSRGTGLSFDPNLRVDTEVHNSVEEDSDMHASMQHVSTGVSALAG